MYDMKNPIPNDFDWSSLYSEYDGTCKRFNQDSDSLYAFDPRPQNDRELYYMLIERTAQEIRSNGLELGTYEGILYWKLYSQAAAVARTCIPIRKLGKKLPQKVKRTVDDVTLLFNTLNEHSESLYGLKNSCAIPVRSTLLHFIYPEIIPIFDKQVLKAVGITEKDANKDWRVFDKYVPFAWKMADSPNIPKDWKETPLRLVDMALWVLRGKE